MKHGDFEFGCRWENKEPIFTRKLLNTADAQHEDVSPMDVPRDVRDHFCLAEFARQTGSKLTTMEVPVG